MSESLSLPKETYLVLSNTLKMRDAIHKGSFCQCCGVRSHVEVWSEHSWAKFGMMGSFDNPKEHIEKLQKNREWLTIPDKDGAFTLDWAPENRELHDI